MSTLMTLREAGLLGPLDHRFGQAMARLGSAGDAVALAAALASRAVDQGDVGVHLPAVPAQLAEALASPPALPAAASWRTALREATALVRGPHESRSAPLVLDGDDLYLERTWAQQQRLARWVRQRLTAPHHPVDASLLATLLGQLQLDDPRSALQRRAAVSATRRGFSLLAGGPGTGKTAVVARVLALLQALEQARTGRTLRVRLAAPTGKAAARLSESIRENAVRWVPAALRTTLDLQASTIHRMLGWRGPGRFVHDRFDPLPLDLLVVDEASMVDLSLMTQLLDAVPDGARVLLLGDPDQLASVEVGSVFADLVRACTGPVSSTLAATWQATHCPTEGAQVTGPDPQPGDALTVLTHTWRYGANSGIAALAEAVNAGDADAALSVLTSPAYPDVTWWPQTSPHDRVRSRLESLVLDPYAAVAQATSPKDAIARLRALRVLGAHRTGGLGVNTLNAHLEQRVRQRLGVDATVDWYAGRPVMVTRNDSDMRLYNGDVGVVLADDQGLQVHFEQAESCRAVPPVLLPEHVSVFATTVHKSQGSEYDHVVLVVPGEGEGRLVTRELLYTGLTRAREAVTVVASEDAVRAGVERRVRRMSRLEREVLRGAT